MKSTNLNGSMGSDQKNENEVELITKNPSFSNYPIYTRFKLRAECIYDVIQFIRSRKIKNIWYVKIEQQEVLFPDVDFEFNTRMSLKEILIILSKIPDSHVMMDTINPIEKYTGKRRRVDWENEKITDELVAKLLQD